MRHHIIQEDVKIISNDIRKEASKLAGKTLLITGASGFLGSYFLAVIEELNKNFKKPCQVIALDNYITGEKQNILGPLKDKNITFIKHDVTKPFKTSRSIDYIINAAGIASPVYYMKYPLETIKTATWGTENMLILAKQKKVKSFLYFSSSEIYGDPSSDAIPTPETYRGFVSSVGPRACYDESKRLGETICMSYYKLFNIPIKIVRPFNVFGPGMKPNDYRVMPRFLSNALQGEPLPVHGNGKQTRTYCYITDAITGFLKVLLSKENGEIYNIGNDQNEMDLVTLANMVAGLFDYKIKISKVPYPAAYPADEPNRRCPDLSKAKAKLNYHPKVTIHTGLPRLLNWYRDSFDFKLKKS